MELGMPNLQTYYQRVCVCVCIMSYYGDLELRGMNAWLLWWYRYACCVYMMFTLPFSTFLSATCCARWEILPSPRPHFIDVGTTIHRHSCNYNKEDVLSGKIPIYFAVNLWFRMNWAVHTATRPHIYPSLLPSATISCPTMLLITSNILYSSWLMGSWDGRSTWGLKLNSQHISTAKQLLHTANTASCLTFSNLRRQGDVSCNVLDT